ncbi:hypothetical protein MJO28_004832 [Puccinia striiformis f. sp. tritici]|uniref:Uncharacterized protein n=1 Tax=Puccinia striiformis f. sp. tritici TaxID=168172 RepID=A0ACC0EK83_9BASI|nr:hypothetical protein Pst134EB_033389 [Puccinia striiformis f. sp. tritici]KAI7954432.1 hypothetical protein MJO28_004832 [Puccinia striiformis f. sp. tritici]
MERFISLTRVSCRRGVEGTEWAEQITKIQQQEEEEEDYGSALIELILASKVTSIRLLSYYRTAISKQIIEPSRAASKLIITSNRITTNKLNWLAEPLLSQQNLAVSVEEHLDPLLELINSTTTTKEEQPISVLAQILLRSIANELLAKPVTTKLDNRTILKITQTIAPNDDHLHSLLRHLSPSTAKGLAYNPSSRTSTTASGLIAYILLTPGGATSFQPFISFASSRRDSFILELLSAAIQLGNVPKQELEEEDQDINLIPWIALLAGGRLAEIIRTIIDSIDKKDHITLLDTHQLQLLSSKINPQKIWYCLLDSLIVNNLVDSDTLPHLVSLSDSVGTDESVPVYYKYAHHSCLELGLHSLANSLSVDISSTTISELINKLVQSLRLACESFDLSRCISITKSITKSESLSVLFIWAKPVQILAPIRELLDDWNSIRNRTSNNHHLKNDLEDHRTVHSNENDGGEHHHHQNSVIDESSSGSEFEKFGALLGWIQGVIGRFNLMANLGAHLGSTKGFTINYTSNPSQSYSLTDLGPIQMTTLSTWIESLYGSTGIPDDLLIKTDPRIFFMISTSLFKQSFDALKAGLIDLQTFRDGLSYFEHKLLVEGCAIGVIGWLLDELSRLGPISPSSFPTALIEILQSILLSESISSTALFLVSARSLKVLRQFDKLFTDRKTCLIEEDSNSDLNRRVQLNLEVIEQRLTVLPTTEMITPARFISFDFGESNVSWSQALDMAVKMAIDGNLSEEEDSQDRTIPIWSLLPQIMKALKAKEFVKILIGSIVKAIKPDPDPPSPRPCRRVEKAWDIHQYQRLERAIGLAVDILTWPADLPSSESRRLRALEELFGGWGNRLSKTTDIDHAEIERDILLGCLERLHALELVHSSSSGVSSSLNQDTDGNSTGDVEMRTSDDHHHTGNQTNDDDKDLVRNLLSLRFRLISMESLRREKLKQIGVLDVYLDAQPRSLGGSERTGKCQDHQGVRAVDDLGRGLEGVGQGERQNVDQVLIDSHGQLLVEKADHQLNDLGVEDVNGLENQNRIEIELEPEPATGAQTATATATATGSETQTRTATEIGSDVVEHIENDKEQEKESNLDKVEEEVEVEVGDKEEEKGELDDKAGLDVKGEQDEKEKEGLEEKEKEEEEQEQEGKEKEKGEQEQEEKEKEEEKEMEMEKGEQEEKEESKEKSRSESGIDNEIEQVEDKMEVDPKESVESTKGESTIPDTKKVHFLEPARSSTEPEKEMCTIKEDDNHQASIRDEPVRKKIKKSRTHIQVDHQLVELTVLDWIISSLTISPVSGLSDPSTSTSSTTHSSLDSSDLIEFRKIFLPACFPVHPVDKFKLVGLVDL